MISCSASLSPAQQKSDIPHYYLVKTAEVFGHDLKRLSLYLEMPEIADLSSDDPDGVKKVVELLKQWNANCTKDNKLDELKTILNLVDKDKAKEIFC